MKFFFQKSIPLANMEKTKEVTCRYGVTYPVTFKGSKAEIARSFDLMTRCCCWVCHNQGCETPHNEVLPDCQKVCEIWTKVPYCHDKLDDIEAKD
jgi:hypothetical protein